MKGTPLAHEIRRRLILHGNFGYFASRQAEYEGSIPFTRSIFFRSRQLSFLTKSAVSSDDYFSAVTAGTITWPSLKIPGTEAKSGSARRAPATLAALTSRPQSYESAPVHPPSSKG
jgi:hypothetical protein